MKTKLLFRIYKLIGTVSWLFIICILTFYFHAAIYLIKFPAYDKPDPKNLPFYFFYSQIINDSLLLWLISILPSIYLFFMLVYKDMPKFKLVSWLVLFGNLVTVYILFSNISDWYFD